MSKVKSSETQEHLKKVASDLTKNFIENVEKSEIGKKLGKQFVRATVPPVAALTIGTATFNRLINRKSNGKKK